MSSDARIEDVEVKVAFLENSVAELDTVVRQLYTRIETLERELMELRETSAPDGSVNTLEDEKPPHY